MPFKLRRASDEDAEAISDLYFASFRLLTFLPMLHTAEDNRRFVANVILKECAVTVAEDETGIVSFLALLGARPPGYMRQPSLLRDARPAVPR